MSRRGGKNRNKCNGNKVHWQSADLNRRLYNYYYDIILKMAISRFRWLNLPKTCDERYLEYTLVTEGMASIAFPHKLEGKFLSLQCTPHGMPNMYDRPVKWEAVGQNGTRYFCSRKNGVTVFDNETHFPLAVGIDLYANELAHLRITKRMNRLHQQIPFVLDGPQEKRQDMVNMFKQVAGGEPAILTTDSMQQIEYKALSTGVPFLGEELAIDEANVWSRIYTMLGIKNSPVKQERQTEDEIRAQENPTTLIASSSLIERRKAADELNLRFGHLLDKPIQVVWRQDNISENYNLTHNIKSMAKAGE